MILILMTTSLGLALCPILFEKDSNPISQARLATVWLGTNDAIEPGFSQHVPLEEYKSNMTSILREHFNSLPVLLITPTTVVNGLFEGHTDDSNHERYGQALQEIANELNPSRKEAERIIVIDMRKAFLQAAHVQEGGLKALFDSDGLHLAIPGYKVVFDATMAAIETYFPHLSPDKLKYVIPDWKELYLNLDQEGQKKQLLP
jgi:isoamyl acetate esterase